MGFQKQDFRPLLPEGFHIRTLAEIESLCVDAFPLSTTRRKIADGISGVVEMISVAGLRGDLWVDGSFLTEKIDPEDADLLLALHDEDVQGYTPEQQRIADKLAGDDTKELKKRYMCDIHVHVEFPTDHPSHPYGEWMRAYWIKLYGWDHDGMGMKGIAVIEIRP